MTYLSTISGRHVNYLEPDVDCIDIEDIAHALAHTCRYSGHVSQFYSVAQHCVIVSVLLPMEMALEGLLHDAAEAYCCDIPSPLKRLLPDYKRIENQFDTVIRDKYGLPKAYSPEVKRADLIALATEKRDFGIDRDMHWPVLDGVSPATINRIIPYSPEEAKAAFISRFNHLYCYTNKPFIPVINPTDISSLYAFLACDGDDGQGNMFNERFVVLIRSAIDEINYYREQESK